MFCCELTVTGMLGGEEKSYTKILNIQSITRTAKRADRVVVQCGLFE
jgi:hypothetical protein